MKAGLFGGTFNPIHYGHLRAAEALRERLLLDKIIFIPAGNPPFKRSDLAPAPDRFEMTRLATAGNPSFALSDIECRKPGKSYTVDTIAELKGLYPQDELLFVLGIDTFMEIPDWHEPDRLAGLIDFVIINRPPHLFGEILRSPYIRGESFEEPPAGREGIYRVVLTSGRTAYLAGVNALPISASEIRASAKAGRSIKYLLPEAVESFIMSHGLY